MGQRTWWKLGIVWTLAIVGFGTPVIQAQEYTGYKQIRVRDDKQFDKVSSRAREIVVANRSDKTSEQELKAYILQYFLPSLTDARYADRLAKLRMDFRKLHADASPTMKNKLVQLIAGPISRLLSDEGYHPAARVNAVVLLGELNVQEARPPDQPPIPEKMITPFLIRLAQNPSQHEAVRVAALTQVLRHVQLRSIAGEKYALSAEERNRIRELGLALLNDLVVPTSRSQEAHEWLRQLGAQLLQALKDPGPNQIVTQSLTQVLKDDTLGLNLRCRALQAFAALDFAKNKPDPQTLARDVASLVLAILGTEIETMAEIKQDPNSAAYGPNQRIEVDPGFNDDNNPRGSPKRKVEFEDKRTIVVRRRLLQRLPWLREALVGDNLGAKGLSGQFEPSTFVDSLTAIDAALKLARDPTLSLDTLGVQMLEIRDQLRRKYPDADRRRPRGRRNRDREGVARRDA